VVALDRREILPEALRQALAASLAPAERQRLEALRQLADRERFLRGRAALRLLLGAWLALPPAAVPIEVGPHGKPHCPGGPQFNLSHSGDLILLALHPSRPVGVDVELPRPDLDWRPIARRVLPAAEAEALERLAAGDGGSAAADRFLGAWCRLEAGLKARGLGLAGLGDPPQGLTVWDVAVPAGYRAAVALTAHPAAAPGVCPPDPPG
jgi:4'-phosphopantetheinyl transferase